MNEIYPLWVAAHGIIIVAPVHWYQSPTVLKLMMDRMVRRRRQPGPDFNAWQGRSKGRVFSIIVHGDSAGADNLRRMLTDWLTDMHLRPAGEMVLLGPVHWILQSRTQRATLSWTATARSSLKQEMQP